LPIDSPIFFFNFVQATKNSAERLKHCRDTTGEINISIASENEVLRTYGHTRKEVTGMVKVKLFLCLTKYHAMKTYWGNGGVALRILDLGTRWR
jgi:hypothetical protein